MRSVSIAAFAALLLAQALPAAGVAWQHAERLRTGQPIRLAVDTRDPRDLFRGEYSTLTYEIGQLRGVPLAADAPPPCAISRGDSCAPGAERPIFLALAPDAAGIHRAATVSFERPADGLFIAGRLRNGLVHRHGATLPDKTTCDAASCVTGRAVYDIERWYGPQGRPAKLDAAPRASVLVEARVGPDGFAILDGISVGGTVFARTARLW